MINKLAFDDFTCSTIPPVGRSVVFSSGIPHPHLLGD
jgi:hypothetical protein